MSKSVLGIGCCIDAYMDLSLTDKLLKYQPLLNALTQCRYQPLLNALTQCSCNCKLIALIYGSLGHAPGICVRGLQMVGLNKRESKDPKLARYCSAPAVELYYVCYVCTFDVVVLYNLGGIAGIT